MIRARKRFGQHFLQPAWVDKLIRAIDPAPEQTFLEIGPGTGALTRPLAARCRRVIACEIDRDLARELRESAPPNVEIVEGDFLEISDCRLQIADFVRVAGNLPYNVASRILFRLVDLHRDGLPIADATVMLQREVADRLLAPPGTKDYGVLSVLIRHGADVERVMNLPPGAFRPMPKVQSSVVRLRFHPPDPPVQNYEAFREVVQTAFTHRRKTLANALKDLQGLTRGQIGGRIRGQIRGQIPGQIPGQTPGRTPLPGWVDGRRRPETLSVAEFAALSDVFSSR